MSARSTRRLLHVVLFAWVGLALAACGEGAEPLADGPRPPHIVVLLTDDQGWNDVGYHGSEIATPHIDRLAADGLRLERFYTAPICTPTRASLMTGKHPLSVGLIHNLRPEHVGGLALEERILPQYLAPAGYVSALVGKWHLGHARPEQWPTARGFDTAYGLLGGYVDYYDHTREGELDWQRDGEPLVERGYATRLIANEAVRVLAEHDTDRPLFLYVAFSAPHGPLQPAPGRGVEGVTEEEQKRRCYAGMVEELDAAIGRIVDALEARGIADDTLLLFASDNGGSLGYGADNAPLRYGKYGVFEGGIRVPAVVRWPGHLPRGASDQVVTVQDLLPTFLAVAGLEPPPDLDGRDVLPALADERVVEREDLVWAVRRRAGHRFAARRGPWKLVREVDREWRPVETLLFDVEADPNETTDLAAQHPELVGELWAEIERGVARHPGDLDERPR